MAAARKGSAGGAPAPTRHLEIETKLEIDPGAPLPPLTGRRALVAAGIAKARPPMVHELDAVYFDTDQHDLLRSKITLRRRTGGSDDGWHVKLPAAAGARTEVALPLDAGPHLDAATAAAERPAAQPAGPGSAAAADAPAPVTLPGSAVPSTLAQLVSGAARGRPLRPVARIANHRTVYRLIGADGTELVEVADDHVTAHPLAPNGSALPGSSWRELEAELLAGSRHQLAAAVQVLTAAGARPASSASKLARALGVPATTASAPRAKRRQLTAGEAAVAALGRARDAIITTDRALREQTPTALHDARAAARRARSVLRVFRRLFETEWAQQLANGLQAHAAVLSPARDLEVIAGRLDRQLIDEPAEYAAAAAACLRTELGARRAAAAADVDRQLSSPAYFDTLRSLDAFIAGPPVTARADRPATAELPTHLIAAWRRLKTLGDGLAADPETAPNAHAARKRAKELRYATEAAASALGEPAVVFAAAVEQVQEVLGELQDATVTADLLAELALAERTDGQAGFVFGRLHAFEQAAAHGAVEEFLDAWDRVADGELLAELARG